MGPAERVESQDLQPVRRVAEPVDRRSSLAVRERARVVELGQGGFGRLEVGDQHAVLIGRAQVERPGAVRLVFQDVATSETERPLE